ncbi:MAG: MarR family transcriptional regulator [Proteobacteria bacterium]|nr:MAG: MarR family transcriptional regulator [Pseudomonadota bacterium]
MPAAEDAILRSLRRITRAIDLHSRWLASNFGLTIPQLVSLRTLAGTEAMTPTELARAVDLSQATITGIIDRLVRRALVTRERSTTDRRRVVLTITDAGRRLLEASPSPLQERFVTRLSKLPLENQEVIRTVLEQVVRMMGAEELDAAAMLTSGPQTASADAVEEFLEAGAGDGAEALAEDTQVSKG